MDPEQTASIGAFNLGPPCLPADEKKQTTFVAIGTLRVKAYQVKYGIFITGLKLKEMRKKIQNVETQRKLPCIVTDLFHSHISHVR